MDAAGDAAPRGSPARATPRPRYMTPNFSSLLPAFANAEADHIRSAFARTHHASLLKLPARLAPHAVNRSRLEQMDANRLGSDGSDRSSRSSTSPPRTNVPKLATAATSGLFQPLEYAPSPFARPDELAQLERLRSHAQRSAISGAPFVGGGKPARLKHEDAFGDARARYPHLAEPSPPAARDVGVQRGFLREPVGAGGRGRGRSQSHNVLAGDLGGTGGAGGTVTRKLLPEMLRELRALLAADWPALDLEVAPDATGEAVVVSVREASVESELALAAYMDVLVRSHHVVASKFRLRKVAEDWHAKPGDGAIYFALRPPWAKNRSRDTVVVLAADSGRQ